MKISETIAISLGVSLILFVFITLLCYGELRYKQGLYDGMTEKYNEKILKELK